MRLPPYNARIEVFAGTTLVRHIWRRGNFLLAVNALCPCLTGCTQGIPVWYSLVGLAVPGQLLLAVEANRHGSGGLLAWYTFFAVVLQVTCTSLRFVLWRLRSNCECNWGRSMRLASSTMLGA